MDLDAICAIVGSIPSTVLVALLALLGVIQTNISNTNRLLKQLRQDAHEAATDRAHALRREVYLQAADELTRAQAHLASIVRSNPTKTNFAEGLQGFFGASAKLQLVSEPKTAVLMSGLTAAYTGLLLRLTEKAMPAHSARIDIKINDKFYRKALEQAARVSAEMRRFNEEMRKDFDVFEALGRSHDEFLKQMQEYDDQRTAAWSRFNHAHLEFNRNLMIETRTMSALHVPVMVEMRRDLGLTTDLQTYQEELEKQWQQASTEIENFLRAVVAAENRKPNA